ncbi:MAG: hypothetical protein J2P36_39965, partial [Ktedonobacteraceae bacterium]|nr:hypothetical protein [Ktedonobacteraceae bacterium]
LVCVGFFPFFLYAVTRVFFFKGEGEALPPAQLRYQLEKLNTYDAPVIAEPKRWGYLFTWRYVDTKWREAFQRAGLTAIYSLHVKLNERQHEATLTEVTRSVSWNVGAGGVRVGGSVSRGIVSGWERNAAWGIDENFAPGKFYDYTFSPDLVKNPVINTILRSGWDVRFAVF